MQTLHAPRRRPFGRASRRLRHRREISAAADVHTLLIAIRDDDRSAFDAHVDRPALEAEFQAVIVERTRASGRQIS